MSNLWVEELKSLRKEALHDLLMQKCSWILDLFYDVIAEWTHTPIRSELGFGAEDPDNIRDILAQRYHGSRYSFGYPACPNMQDQFKLLDFLNAKRVDLVMDESE
jgi:cobalamin-dependent methionine synthase I